MIDTSGKLFLVILTAGKFQLNNPGTEDMLQHEFNNGMGAIADRILACIDIQIGVGRDIKRIINAAKVLYLVRMLIG
mgnify:CR=1 FL=1